MASNMNIKADHHTLLLNYALKKFLTLSPDITIVAKDGKLEVNRLLLCMYSPTISSAFSHCSSTKSIFLPDFPVASVWILIDLLIFGFSSRVDLTADWFQNVLDIAKILQIQIKKQNVQVIDSKMCFEQTDMVTKTGKTSETNHLKDLQVDDPILNDNAREEKVPSTTQENSCEDSHGSENNAEDIKWEKDRTVYEVTCKDSKGEFHLDKFSGGRGLCVFFGGSWMTPGNFEKLAGSKAKNYKKSLQLNGTPIKNLMDPYGIGLVIPSPKQKKLINPSKCDGEMKTTEGTDEVSNETDKVSNATELAKPSVQQKQSTNLDRGDDQIDSAGTQELTDDIRLNGEDSIKVVEEHVYEVKCKESRGEFHHEKFISGGKGQCILFNEKWMTPNDFERLAGSRGKKYKETLHVNGKPLKLLIEPHGSNMATPSGEMTPKMEKRKLSNVEVTPKMGNKKLSGDNLKHVTPKLKKQENTLNKECNRNSVSPLMGGEDMQDDKMADISKTAHEAMADVSNTEHVHTKKRKRHSDEPSSARKSQSKKIKLDVIQESIVKCGHDISEVATSPAENDGDDCTKIKTKAEMKDNGDARTGDKSHKNVRRTRLTKEVYLTNGCKCECGAILNNALLLKFHKNEECVTYKLEESSSTCT